MQKEIIKKNIYCLIIFVFFILIIFFYSNKNNVNISPVIQTASINNTISFPNRLVIPKIEVDALIEQVGVTTDGRMDVPKTSSNVGWYKFGTIPGYKGNAVIAGHLNNFLGLPLVFWKLDELEIGDDIYVIKQDGTEVGFKVIKKELYDYNSFNTNDIFGPTDSYHLNLITCSGVWVKDIKNYNKRLVIFAEVF